MAGAPEYNFHTSELDHDFQLLLFGVGLKRWFSCNAFELLCAFRLRQQHKSQIAYVQKIIVCFVMNIKHFESVMSVFFQ